MMRPAAALVLAITACTSTAVPPPASPAAVSATPGSASATAPAATATVVAQSPRLAASPGPVTLREFAVPAGSGPHDVAPAVDGGVWFTAQRSGELGWLDPTTGQTKHVKLGQGSSPHGVILGPDGAPWITDSGLNAIVRVDPRTSEVKRFPLPGAPAVRNTPANLNTAVFDRTGVLWWTGQNGYYGRVTPEGEVHQSVSPRGRGPYGITAVPRASAVGDPGVYYASLAGNHIAEVFWMHGEARTQHRGFNATPIDPPTKDSGPRRVWSDSKGVIWVSEWNAGQLGRYDPISRQWKEWKLPGARPQPYAVFVDDRDIVWLSDFGASAIVRFDPATEKFDVFPHAANGNVRQLHGRPGEVWGALSALDKLIVVTTR